MVINGRWPWDIMWAYVNILNIDGSCSVASKVQPLDSSGCWEWIVRVQYVGSFLVMHCYLSVLLEHTDIHFPLCWGVCLSLPNSDYRTWAIFDNFLVVQCCGTISGLPKWNNAFELILATAACFWPCYGFWCGASSVDGLAWELRGRRDIDLEIGKDGTARFSTGLALP